MKDTLALFETSKLAKEKGLQLPVSSDNDYWAQNGLAIHPYSWFSPSDFINYIDALTQSQLQNWLWKKHKIWVEVTLWGDGIGFQCLIKQAKGKEEDGSTIVRVLHTVDVGLACSKPTDAIEKGLFETLKLIK